MVGRPAEAYAVGVGRGGGHEVGVLQPRPIGIGRQAGAGEADQALLGLEVHRGEFAAVDHVVRVAGDGPRPLRLAGERAGVDVGEPVEQGRLGLALVVEVAVLVLLQHPGRGIAEGERAVGGPRRGGALGEAAEVAAVVRMPGDVERAARREDGVGVAVAVLDPDQIAVPVGLEGALEVAGRLLEGVAGAVEPAAVRRRHQGRDRGLGAPVADQVVHRHRQVGAGRRVEQGETVPRSARGAHAGEGAARPPPWIRRARPRAAGWCRRPVPG